MFTEWTEIATSIDEKVKFVVALKKTRIKPDTIVNILRPIHRPVHVELADDQWKGNLPSRQEAEAEAHIHRTHLIGLWPHARLCLVITSYEVPVPGWTYRPPAVADLALGYRQGIWTHQILNQSTFDKMMRGADMPPVAALSEARKELRNFFQTYGKAAKPFSVPIRSLPSPNRF